MDPNDISLVQNYSFVNEHFLPIPHSKVQYQEVSKENCMGSFLDLKFRILVSIMFSFRIDCT